MSRPNATCRGQSRAVTDSHRQSNVFEMTIFKVLKRRLTSSTPNTVISVSKNLGILYEFTVHLWAYVLM